MKKILGLLAVIAVLMFTSCEKEGFEPVTNTNDTTKVTAFDLYNYVKTTDFVVGIDTVVNDTTYIIDTVYTLYNLDGDINCYFYRIGIYTDQNKIGYITIVNSIEGDETVYDDQNIITILIFELNTNQTISKMTLIVYDEYSNIINKKVNIYDENGEFIEQIIII